MPTAADDAFCCQGPAKILIPETWWQVGLLVGSKRFGYEPHCFFCRSEGDFDLSAEMLVSFLRRRLGSVLLVLHRDCVVFCATEAAALTVVLLSLPLRCQQNCVDITGTLSLVCSREKYRSVDCFIDVVAVPSCWPLHLSHGI